MQRYTVGFKSLETRAFITDRNPGWLPIVDNHSFGALGVVIAICDTAIDAERITNLLNAAEPITPR